jgi:hypothetical protein
MVSRIVLFKLGEEHATDEGRAAFAGKAGAAAAALPALRAVQVGTPADDASLRSWDVLVLLSFDDAAAAARAVADPAYRGLVDDAAADVVKAWSFYSTS